MTSEEKFEKWVKKVCPSKTMGENWLTSCELTCMRMAWLEQQKEIDRLQEGINELIPYVWEANMKKEQETDYEKIVVNLKKLLEEI